MQVADLRLLLRLPAPELEPDVGCNLTMATVLLGLISGFSVWFFETDDAAAIRAEEDERGHPLSRRRFLAFVTTYWPGIEPEGDPATTAKRLYEVRNSLAHDLGAHNDPKQEQPRIVHLAKQAYSLDNIVTGLELNKVHPLKVPVIEDRDGAITIHLAGLYWAVLWMLKRAIEDKADSIEARMADLAFPELDA